ncbi:hypothetical protein ECE50_025865 [Chitinophaga sp. Mgbs1]|uniref:Uncharacterized protein n=1 Tax=Chitinophaga solisilvae TaxID=1233460 RepID=A0A9Q5DE13_9BACT|nr:hypothetical protein [Chitinophaga solisilvae]
MKKYQLLPAGCMIAAAVLCFSNCIKPRPGEWPVPSRPAGIAKIAVIHQGQPDTFTFSYNSYGNPLSIVPQHYETGWNQFTFKYDNQQRMVSRKSAYTTEDIYDFLHRYRYDHLNRIVRDTEYYVFPVNDLQPISTTAYTYDNLHRIIKTVREFLPGPVNKKSAGRRIVAHDYYYNALGNAWKIHISDNLFCPDECSEYDIYPQYDNHVNYHRLHPLWQFLSRDYSRNNAVQAFNYNSHRLPLAFTIPDSLWHNDIYTLPCINAAQASILYY